MMIPDVVVVDDDDDRDDDAFRVRLQDDSVERFVRLVDATSSTTDDNRRRLVRRPLCEESITAPPTSLRRA